MNRHAIVFRAANQPSLEEIPLPQLNADEVQIRTEYSGVSIGTESSIFSGVRTHNGTFPLVGGYMLSGTVERVGAQVEQIAVGDRVVSSGSRLEPGINSVWGGHVSRAVRTAGAVRKVPEGTSMREAAMFVLPGVALNAVSMVGPTEQDTILIQGQGLIGQLFGQWARLRGARVIVIEPNAQRAKLARRNVTPHVLNPETDDIRSAVEQLTGGKGPSIVVEATGIKSLLGKATAFLTFHGKMVFLGWYPDEITLRYHDFHAHEVRAYFPMGGGDARVQEAVLQALARRQIVLGDNITHVVPWREACEGYNKVIRRDPSILGMVIDWTQS